MPQLVPRQRRDYGRDRGRRPRFPITARALKSKPSPPSLHRLIRTNPATLGRTAPASVVGENAKCATAPVCRVGARDKKAEGVDRRSRDFPPLACWLDAPRKNGRRARLAPDASRESLRSALAGLHDLAPRRPHAVDRENGFGETANRNAKLQFRVWRTRSREQPAEVSSDWIQRRA